jgi:hypothetical protein
MIKSFGDSRFSVYVALYVCIVYQIMLNIVIEWLTLLLCIQEVLSSDLGLETGYPDRGFCAFPQYLQTDFGIVPSN